MIEPTRHGHAEAPGGHPRSTGHSLRSSTSRRCRRRSSRRRPPRTLRPSLPVETARHGAPPRVVRGRARCRSRQNLGRTECRVEVASPGLRAHGRDGSPSGRVHRRARRQRDRRRRGDRTAIPRPCGRRSIIQRSYTPSSCLGPRRQVIRWALSRPSGSGRFRLAARARRRDRALRNHPWSHGRRTQTT